MKATPWGTVAPPPIDPDAPIWTWKGQRNAPQRGTRDRSVTTAVDLVMPASVDRAAHHYVRVGASYQRSYAVLSLPRRLSHQLLSRIARLPGVVITLVNNPQPKQLAREHVRELARQFNLASDDPDDATEGQWAARDVKRHLEDLIEERSEHHLFGLYIRVSAADLTSLQHGCRDVESVCENGEIALVQCDYQHWDGTLTTTPLGYDLLRYLSPTDTPTLARLMPSTPATLPATTGTPVVYGVRADMSGASTQAAGMPVIIDRFDKKIVASPHQAIIAATGGGKTYAVRQMLLQLFAYGHRSICVIDPKDQEYRLFLERVLGGTYLTLSEHSETKLNPLALPYGDTHVVERLRRLNEDVRARRASLVKQLVVTEAKARAIPLSGNAEAQLEEAIYACYEQRKITNDPETFHADVPTLGTILTYLEGLADHDFALCDMLRLFTRGTLGRLINAPGSMPLNAPPSRLRPDVGVLGVDLSAFIYGNDETLKRVIPPLIANYFISVAMNDTERTMELVIDEAWALLNTPAGGEVAETIARIGRSLGVAATIISQQVGEFLYRRTPEGNVVENTSGKAFLNNCETVLLLRQLRPDRGASDDNPVAQAARQFGLRPGEVMYLNGCGFQPGVGSTGLLLAGREPIPLRIPKAPEPLHTMLEQATNRDGDSTDLEETVHGATSEH